MLGTPMSSTVPAGKSQSQTSAAPPDDRSSGQIGASRLRFRAHDHPPARNTLIAPPFAAVGPNCYKEVLDLVTQRRGMMSDDPSAR